MAKVDCWSCGQPQRSSEEMLEQTLMSKYAPCSGGGVCEHKKAQKRWNKIGRSIAGSVAALTNALSMDLQSSSGGGKDRRKKGMNTVIEALMQRHPGSQLPEKLIFTIRRHFESLPSSYAGAGFNSEQVFAHIRLIEQARGDVRNSLAVMFQEQLSNKSSNASDVSSISSSPLSSPASSVEEDVNSDVAITVVSIVGMSRQSIFWAFKKERAIVKYLQVYERKALLLCTVEVLCSRELLQLEKMQGIMRSAIRRSRMMRLSLGLYASDGSKPNAGQIGAADRAVESHRPSQTDHAAARMSVDGLTSNPRIRTNLQGLISCGMEELSKWTLDSSKLHVLDATVGKFNGELVALQQLNMDGVSEYEFQNEVLTRLSPSCVHCNIVPVYGVCVENHKIWLVSRLVRGESLSHLMKKNNCKFDVNMVMHIASDIAKGMQFLHESGVIHSNLRSSEIFLDSQNCALIGGSCIVKMFDTKGERMNCGASIDQWAAPEVSGIDCENSVVTPKTDVYSFGIVLWELISGRAVGASKPAIPLDCCPSIAYQIERCWIINPLDRPDFSEILEKLTSNLSA